MEKYIIYANDTTATIEELFSKCDSQSFENFKKLSAFLEIQNQLDSKQITKTAYSNNDINAYKILSVQQMIYRDMINNRSNLNNILEYLEFVQELLKSDRIDDFYKDLTYRFNNKYIVPWVDNQNNPIIKNKKPEVDNIKKQITIIDNGDDLL
ncbi:hypothetical protein KKG31_04000 [Patescibacteria group bacterium]|nr:hypothetical protein [Patescibacteria group bacterium]MBU1758305.1 hypothetical protein [Patescibacteria group bacterium]